MQATVSDALQPIVSAVNAQAETGDFEVAEPVLNHFSILEDIAQS